MMWSLVRARFKLAKGSVWIASCRQGRQYFVYSWKKGEMCGSVQGVLRNE